MAHSEGENLPLSQDSYMESDEGNFSSDDSLLDDSSDEDYNPSNEDFIEDDESDVDTHEAPANSSPELELELQQIISENRILDGGEPPKKKQRTCKPPKKKQSWKTERDPDIIPSALRFLPMRDPGVQLSASDSHTPLELFKLFFSENTVEVLCRNTNKLAARNQANGAKYKWTDVTVPEFYKYIGMLFYMSLVRLNSVTDYWRRDNIFSVAFPRGVMMRDRYRTIAWNVHMSDPDEDRENDAKKGTPLYDRLFRAKPLMNTILDACKAFYHPRRNLSIDERMVACRAHTGMTQYMKAKPTKWGIKLFVLADSSNGYTVNFSIFAGKNLAPSGKGIAYDTVMSLINRKYLGSGYHIYMDNFYTSAALFTDLYEYKYGACGTYRDSRQNAQTLKLGRGSFRWRRDGHLLFVKWMDSREVNICSTIHTAYKERTIQRKMKNDNGNWTSKSYPCPEPVLEYNKHMGGVDLSDQLIQYYSAQQKVHRWYRKLFFHFLDIAATNAYLIYKELQQQQKNQDKMSHRMFMEELTAQLCGLPSSKMVSNSKKSVSLREPGHGDLHLPIPVQRSNESDCRRTCMYCRKQRNKIVKTSWMCKACDIYLCLTVQRNCFESWHTMDQAACSHRRKADEKANVKTLKGQDQVNTESLKGEDQVVIESLKGQDLVEADSLQGEEDHVETESRNGEAEQVVTEYLTGQDQVETDPLKGQDLVETESSKGEEDQIFLKGQDQIISESLKGQDQIKIESLKGEESQVKTKSVKGQYQVKTESLKGQDQAETEFLKGEEDQIFLKAQDQIKSESLKGQDQIKIESLKGDESQVKTKSVKGQCQVKTESFKSQHQVDTKSLKDQDQVETEPGTSASQD